MYLPTAFQEDTIHTAMAVKSVSILCDHSQELFQYYFWGRHCHFVFSLHVTLHLLTFLTGNFVGIPAEIYVRGSMSYMVG